MTRSGPAASHLRPAPEPLASYSEIIPIGAQPPEQLLLGGLDHLPLRPALIQPSVPRSFELRLKPACSFNQLVPPSI